MLGNIFRPPKKQCRKYVKKIFKPISKFQRQKVKKRKVQNSLSATSTTTTITETPIPSRDSGNDFDRFSDIRQRNNSVPGRFRKKDSKRSS